MLLNFWTEPKIGNKIITRQNYVGRLQKYRPKTFILKLKSTNLEHWMLEDVWTLDSEKKKGRNNGSATY